MGEIVLDKEQGLIYTLPPLPAEKDILYYDLPKKEQYWRTPSDKKGLLDIYDGPVLQKMNPKDRIEHIQKWRMRGLEGLWFMNKGEPTYIPPMMVDHLCYNTFNNRHLKYNKSQRDDFYFRHLIWNMDDVDGMMWIKPRRYGMTYEEITQSIWAMLLDDGCNVALMSDTQDIAKKTLLKPLVNTYVSRAEWLREEYWVTAAHVPRSSLELISKKPGVRALGGTAYVFATKAKGADSTENIYVVEDEFSKILSETNPRQMHDANRRTIRNAGRYGKISALSTTGDSDQVVQSVNEWIKLSGESVLKEGIRGTVSGLVRRFVSAVWSQNLPIEYLPDIYGEVDYGKNEEYIYNEVNKKGKGSKDWYFEKRKMPLSIDDALVGAAGVSYFDKISFVNRRKELEGLRDSEKPYIRGILEFKDRKVVFVSDEERRVREKNENIEKGMWLVSQLPFRSAERKIDTSNRWRRVNGVYFPPVNPEGAIGYDPFRYRKEDTASNHLSNASIIVSKKFDYHKAGDDAPANQYCALFLGRPDDPKDAHKEAIKAALFWGYPVMHERQVESVKETFDAEGMLPFLMKEEMGKYHGVYTDAGGKTTKNGVDMLVSRFKLPKTPNEIDQIDTFPFEAGLIDLDNFDLANTTKFDVFMSMIMCEYGLKQLEFTNITDAYQDEMDDVLTELNIVRMGSGRMQ